MKNIKAVILVACMLCLCLVASGTVAYLTSTDSVTNTFTVGSVEITLDEAKVDVMGKVVSDERVEKNEYHLLPGLTYTKDPTVTVIKESQDVYIRALVKVDNIDKLKEAMPSTNEKFEDFYGADGLFLLQNLCGGWDKAKWPCVSYTTETDDSTGVITGIYEFRYAEKVAKNADANTVLPALFTSITVPGDIDNTGIAKLENVVINVEAHAIQAAGFGDADAAWAKF